MSNYCYAQIQIGGTVAKKWLGDFVQAINQDALCDAAYKRVRLTSAQELRHCLVGEHLYFQDDRARLGMFQQLEEFLRIHRVPFDRYSDPCDIADAKRVVLRKGMKRPELHRCSREGDEYVLREELLPLLKLKDPASLQRRLRGIVGDEIPPLPPFDVSALS